MEVARLSWFTIRNELLRTSKLSAAAVGVWVLVNSLDVITTIINRNTGLISEANPIAMHFWDNTFMLVVFKVVVCSLIAAIFTILHRPHLLWWLNIWIAGVVVWNISQYALVHWMLFIGGV